MTKKQKNDLKLGVQLAKLDRMVYTLWPVLLVAASLGWLLAAILHLLMTLTG
jgi:hypothetical protein